MSREWVRSARGLFPELCWDRWRVALCFVFRGQATAGGWKLRLRLSVCVTDTESKMEMVWCDRKGALPRLCTAQVQDRQTDGQTDMAVVVGVVVLIVVVKQGNQGTRAGQSKAKQMLFLILLLLLRLKDKA